MKKIIFLLSIIFFSCNSEQPTQFSKEALLDMVLSLEDSKLTFGEILYNNKGKTILIDVWASWCGDCIRGIPKIKKIQKEFPEVTFVFLSVDRSNPSWKRAVKKYDLMGQHFNFPKGMKSGDFVDFINLSWIPRYMVIDKKGEIALFKATNASDKKLIEVLKNN